MDPWLAVALEEYKSLRVESLEAIGRLQQIAQYGLATTGVAISAAVVASETDAVLAALVLMVLVPLLVLFGAAMMAMEAQRVGRAGRHLAALETRINAYLPGDSDALRWESELARSRRIGSFRLAAMLVPLVGFAIGPGIGGYLLIDRGHCELAIGLGVPDAMLLVASAVFARRRIRQLEEIAASGSGGQAAAQR